MSTANDNHRDLDRDRPTRFEAAFACTIIAALALVFIFGGYAACRSAGEVAARFTSNHMMEYMAPQIEQRMP